MQLQLHGGLRMEREGRPRVIWADESRVFTVSSMSIIAAHSFDSWISSEWACIVITDPIATVRLVLDVSI